MRDIPIKIVAIPTEIAASVRSTGKAPRYGHPAHRDLATGYGPCRHCLRAFAKGKEDRVLFTYDPFQGGENVPLPGPIYIHAEACERYQEDGGYPEGLRQYPSVLSAYGPDQRLLMQMHVDNGEQPEAVRQLFERDDVRYVHVRDKSAGCYDFRVERAEESRPPAPNRFLSTAVQAPSRAGVAFLCCACNISML